jgi:hypothetical protein
VGTCNEATQSCDFTPSDAACADESYCNGVETCDLVNDCQPGTAIICDDGQDCTDDACSDDTSSCEYTPDHGSCSDGTFCNGSEVCQPFDGCGPGAPVNCDDTFECTLDACNEADDRCDHTPNDADCDNGLYCDGVETCDIDFGCLSGTAADCDDGVDCTDDVCLEATSSYSCENTTNDASCTDGDVCTTDTCDAVTGCGYEPIANCTDCGDGVCEGNGETCDTCSADCGCIGKNCRKGCCGDGECTRWERDSCPVDCG